MQGYKGWTLIEGKLRSGTQAFTWENTTETAKCGHGCEVGACLESHTCSCGFYSMKTLGALLKQYSHFDIYGTVYNHGVVVEGINGTRAEKITILSLFTADFALGKQLQEQYPGVVIMTPPPEIAAARIAAPTYWYTDKRWENRRKREQERRENVQKAKENWPGGPEAEKIRLMGLLKGANRQQIIEFAKEYASTNEWAARNWQGHIEKRTKKAKPGDMVFEANDDTHPYVFIGSTRPNPQASMRYLFDRNGILVKRPNIRRWDEEPHFLEARKQAIEEWE